MQRFLFGFFFGTVFGLTVGTITGLFPRINAALTVIIGVARCVPNVAWIPICIMTLGISEPAKIVLIMIGCFWSVFINTEGGIRGIDPKYLEVARLLGKNRITCIFRVILPAAFPSILMGIREGFGNAWKGIAVAELIASSSGLGFMIAYSREIARPDVMFIGLMSIGGVGLILDILIKGIQKKILQ
ncbi:MAG: ABC transporter permease [Synergistaceae bacterium]|nr:ABC transporter permease [Synergistaceae bacterium]